MITKALAKLSTKVGFGAPTLLDPTLYNPLVTHFGRYSSNIFCSIKCWIEFAFDQTLRPTILLDVTTVLQYLAALSTKLCPESSHVRAASQSRIDFKPKLLVIFATKMADKDQQPETLISECEARPCLWGTFSHCRSV